MISYVNIQQITPIASLTIRYSIQNTTNSIEIIVYEEIRQINK